MNKKNLIFFLLLPGFTLISFAQNIELPTAYVTNELLGNNKIPEKTIGSVYINDDFSRGKITIDDKTFGILLRYNAFNDVFEIKDASSNSLSTLAKKPDIKISLNGKKFLLINYINPNNEISEGYFEVLHDGKTKLLLKHTVKFIESKKPKNSYSTAKPSRLDHKKKYYLQKHNNTPVEVRLKKKDILQVLSNRELEEYLNTNKLKLKNIQELIEALEFYDSLQ